MWLRAASTDLRRTVGAEERGRPKRGARVTNRGDEPVVRGRMGGYRIRSRVLQPGKVLFRLVGEPLFRIFVSNL